jgi:hypothetical protein
MSLIDDIIGWDVVNWSQCLKYWESNITLDFNNCHALELGCQNNGGLSLWLALKGANVLCSGYEEISNDVKETHNYYINRSLINYATVDATCIPYNNLFDIVCFKSVIGGIVRENSLHTACKVAHEIKHSLNNNGILLFAENIASTKMHRNLRKKYGYGKNNWRYFTIEEISKIFSCFSSLKYITFGFLGCFGRNEKQRRFLGNIDKYFLDNIVSEKKRYIIAGIAKK